MNPILQLAAEKKDSKNGAARIFFGPSYFSLQLDMHNIVIVGFQFSSQFFQAVLIQKMILPLAQNWFLP